MKVIKPFFLGILGGLALALALVAGLYFSPLRETAYFRADPEMASIRAKLDRYQEWLSHTDFRLAQGGERVSDSLRTAQTKAWRDYKGWRTRLGELARAHEAPTASGFWPWAYSLRFWILPIAGLLALLPGAAFAWRARSRFRPGRRPKPVPNAARAQALSSFEDAVKKVARISKAESGRFPAGPKPAKTKEPEPKRKEPETKPLPLSGFGTQPAPDGNKDTRYVHIGPTWGGPLDLSGAPPSGNPPPPAAGSAGGPGLAMEDEDSENPETYGVMPPTTEVERVERRKDEVLKLARKGVTSSEISRRLRISQDQVEFIIRLRREKG